MDNQARIEAETEMESDSQTNRSIKGYLNELRENINFVVGLSGLMFVLVVFHYSIFKIRESEYYSVNTDLLTEGILIEGIRNFLESIVLIIGILGIIFAATFWQRYRLTKTKIRMSDSSGNYSTTYIILMALIVSGIYCILDVKKQYTDEIPDTIYAFLLFSSLLLVHLFITMINFYLTVDSNDNESSWELPVVLHFAYIFSMFLFIIIPFMVINNQVVSSESITMTSDKKYMLVEKDRNNLLLRKVKVKDSSDDEYEILDEYIFRDSKNVEIVEFKKENYISFEKDEIIKLIIQK